MLFTSVTYEKHSCQNANLHKQRIFAQDVALHNRARYLTSSSLTTHYTYNIGTYCNRLSKKLGKNVPNSVTYLNRTPRCQWYMGRCGSQNGYQKDMCLNEMGLHAPNMITILNSTTNINGMGRGEEGRDFMTI